MTENRVDTPVATSTEVRIQEERPDLRITQTANFGLITQTISRSFATMRIHLADG